MLEALLGALLRQDGGHRLLLRVLVVAGLQLQLFVRALAPDGGPATARNAGGAAAAAAAAAA